MTRKLLSLVGVGLLAVALTGCATGDQVFRGQSPAGACNTCPPTGPGARRAMMQQRRMARRPAGGRMMGRPCGPNGRCGGACGGASRCLFGQNGMPVHRNFVDYQAPQNLSYPEQNTPAATVQYPYYTLRGPTDFFMK